MVVKSSIADELKDVNALPYKKLFSFKKKEIETAFKNAMFKAKAPGLRLIQSDTPAVDTGKILVVTPKKCGPANKRNRFKRRVKAIFYEEELHKTPIVSIIIANRRAMKLSFDEIKEFLKKNIEA